MSKIRKSARDKECQVRVPHVCNGNTQTTVLAHLNGFRVGHKALDIHGAYACSSCHSWLDGGYAGDVPRGTRDLYHLEAVIRTQIILAEDGLLSF